MHVELQKNQHGKHLVKTASTGVSILVIGSMIAARENPSCVPGSWPASCIALENELHREAHHQADELLRVMPFASSRDAHRHFRHRAGGVQHRRQHDGEACLDTRGIASLPKNGANVIIPPARSPMGSACIRMCSQHTETRAFCSFNV